jgi:hypothetical protein
MPARKQAASSRGAAGSDDERTREPADPSRISAEESAWLERCNEQALALIERQGRTVLGLVPFVGAGLSTAFGFSDWRNLLLGNTPPKARPEVQRLLDASDYEGAAEKLLETLGADGFQNMVAVAAGDRTIDEQRLRNGTMALLPLLGVGPVITTNFDRLLEAAFAANGQPFESVVSGPRPDLIVDALHGNRHVLIKLHGDWQDRVGRTFARSDYDANYGDAQPEIKRTLLQSVQRLLFSGRSLLFIGSSLGADRTVEVLRQVQQEAAGVRHFAIMTVPNDSKSLHEKEQQLRQLGVMPLWYHAADAEGHELAVRRLLEEVVERIAVRRLTLPAAQAAITVPLLRRQRLPSDIKASLPKLDGHFRRIVNLIHAGRLTFFLGSAVHSPTKLMAKDFYSDLALTFECEALSDQRSAVTQHILDRHGRDTLEAEIDKLLERSDLQPREAHELFAAWPRLLQGDGEPLPWPWVFTTNYDDVLEQVLRAEAVPHHVFVYHADGEWQGRFCHRAVDGRLRVIERPDSLLTLEEGLVVVKLNGGAVPGLPRSYVSTTVDYVQLAARIPGVLPEVARRRLRECPLLFLGHGLSEPDVEALVRYAHLEQRGVRSWAIVLKKSGIDYWRQCGVDILNYPVNHYLQELYRRLVGTARTSSNSS